MPRVLRIVSTTMPHRVREQGAGTVTVEIKVMSSPPMRSVIHAVGPQFEKGSGFKLAVKIASVVELRRRIDAGEDFDVAILTSELIDALIKGGKIAAKDRVNIARSGLGVAVRAGGRKVDVSSTEAFRQALLDAKSVMYASGSAATAHIDNVFEKLGVVEQVKSKVILQPAGGHIGSAIAEGAAELGLTHIPVILESSGAELAGPLPAELRFHVDFSSGTGAASMEPEGARALIRYLMAPEVTAVIKAKGLERLSH